MKTSALSKEAWVVAALERYQRPLVQYAFRITGKVESARDVVQETFLKLCAADRAAVEDHLAAWLYTVCRNHALNVRRKEAREMEWDAQQTEAPSGDDVGETAARNEIRGRVLEVVERLPQDQQEAFHLKFRDGLNYREISAVMGVSLGTVSNLVTAALNRIRHELRSDLDLANTQEV